MAISKSPRIRVLIGDRQPIFRSGLNQLLSKEPGITVVGEAEDCEQTLKLTNERKPSILLLDSFLVEPGSAGAGILEELQHKHKNVKVILLTPTERGDRSEMLKAKGVGVIPKQAPFDSLLQWIYKLDSGEAWVDAVSPPGPARQLQATPASMKPTMENSPLSVRERQVVGLVSQGFKNKEIAERMFISEQTVKNHLHNIFDKLGVSDRLELALYAIHRNIQSLE